MKKIKYILTGCLSIMLLASSCSDDNSYVINSDPDIFSIEPIAIVADAEGGSYDLTVMGHENWNIRLTESNSSVDGWCSVSEMSGSGQASLKVNVTQSGSFTKRRSIIIEVTNGDKVLRARVLQGTQILGENEVLINGNVWSTVNVGNPGTFVESPDQIGMLYQFNRNEPWPFESNPAGWPGSYTNDGTDWLPENDPCPEGWRVPTTQEMSALWEIGSYWAPKAQTGFDRNGIIVGLDPETAKLANKDNLKSLGGLFLPQSGWINSDGILDRTWLVAVRSSNSLSATHGGMSLGDSGGYRDPWGWGDGQKERAAMIRPIKILEVEE